MVPSDREILFPFCTESTFINECTSFAQILFEKYELTPDISQSSLKDAYQFWCTDIVISAHEIGCTTHQSTPSHLKKAGALMACLNKVKPINRLNCKLSYEFSEYSDFKKEIVSIFPNEWFAFEFARHYLSNADKTREGMKEYHEFLSHLSLTDEDILSHEYIKDMCTYMRAKSPSSVSLYTVLRSLYQASHVWRKKG